MDTKTEKEPTIKKLEGTNFIDEFSKEIYEQTYRYGQENIDETHKRVAQDLASNEEMTNYWTNQFQWIQEGFKFVPGGRITSNAGTGLEGTTYINCFAPDMEVMTKYGNKPIADIKIGDEVLTHTGTFKPVVSLMKRPFKGLMDVYKSNLLTKNIWVTPEHPFYATQNKWVQSKYLTKLIFGKVNENKKQTVNIDLYEYVKNIKRNGTIANNVFCSEDIIYTVSEYSDKNGNIITRGNEKIHRHIVVDEDFAYFIGRFIGDGSTFSVNKIYNVDGFNIIFNNDELSSLNRVKTIIENSFGISININSSNEFRATYLRKNNPLVAEFLMTTCGRYSETKKIPSFIWESSESVKKSFVSGLLDADGTITNSEYRLTLNNESLINDIHSLMLGMGLPSMKKSVFNKDYNKNYYQISFSSLFGKELVENTSKTYLDNRIEKFINKSHADKTKGHFTSNILSLNNSIDGDILYTEQFEKELKQYDGFVYNISVLEDESYVINNIIVHNCFVDGFTGRDQDSMEGILAALRRQALILKSEGGYGFCADVMRPRGGFIHGIGNETPGAVRMLDMWDTQSAVITAGSGRKTNKEKAKIKIRKGAQMVTMSCWHPDIEEYITAKQTPGRLTKFNMSVLVTNEFMNAVENKLPWNLEFPDFEGNMKQYKSSWDGNLKAWKEKGLSTTIYKTFDDATELWDLIMKSTYNRNEPGVLFVDVMNTLNNLYYCEYISATNPCGEQVLPVGGVCLLGSLNLTQFVDFKNKDWDYKKLGEVISAAVRLMDNVNDITNVPLTEQKENLKNKRRIGLGIMGYGSALMMMKIRYGSETALKLTEKLMDFYMNSAYQASALIAKEKGSFELFDEEKYLKGEFVKNLSSETIALIKQYGLRNSHLLSIQPTGNSSIFANVVSGGLEPIFLPVYVRTSMMPYAPEGLEIPKNIDWINKKFDSESNWEWIKEGDDNLLKIEFNGYSWKYDRDRGLLRETVVKDYAVRFLEEKGEWDATADWAATTTQLSIDEHVKTMQVMSKRIDSAMSKTVNIPNDYPFEDFKRLYMEFYRAKTIKGGTTYRAGTMTEVLGSLDSGNKTEENKIIKTTAPKRPKTLDCDIYHVTAEGQKWIVIVGLLEGDPYEVFAFKPKHIHIPVRTKSGKLTKVKKGQYDLECEGGLVIEDLSKHFKSDVQEALTRQLSTGLRHGADCKFIVDQLNKSEGTIVSFSKAIARTLKKYVGENEKSGESCPNCGENSLVYQEGCMVCLNCSNSKCG